jgi:hypothetical protein
MLERGGCRRRRKVYDQTGSLSDSEGLAGEDFDSLYSAFRALYKEVSEADIDEFTDGFRGSPEEAAEVLRYYARFKGDMQQARGHLYAPVMTMHAPGFTYACRTCRVRMQL